MTHAAVALLLLALLATANATGPTDPGPTALPTVPGSGAGVGTRIGCLLALNQVRRLSLKCFCSLYLRLPLVGAVLFDCFYSA